MMSNPEFKLGEFYFSIIYVILMCTHPTLEQSTATFDPNYGPEGGGTAVTITSKFFDVSHVISVTIAGQDCNITQSYHTEGVHCITSGRYSWMELNKPLDVTLKMEEGQTRIFPGAFTYKPNPVVNDISPLFSVVSGGVFLTVTGRNLDSVPEIRLMVHTAFNGGIIGTSISQPCTNQDTQKIICPSPEVRIPTLMTSSGSLVSKSKHEISSDSRFNFYIGLQMSGLRTYTNLTRNLQEFSELKLYQDPVVYPFQDGVHRHKPSQGKLLRIKGFYLSPPLSSRDYRISIGNAYCEISSLTLSEISCHLPERASIGDSPRKVYRFPMQVIIGTGKLHFDVGTLIFTSDIKPATWPVVAGVLGLIALILAFTVVAVICFVLKPHK